MTLCNLTKFSLSKVDIKPVLYPFDHTVRPVILCVADVWGSFCIKYSENFNMEKYLDNNKTSLFEITVLKRTSEKKYTKPCSIVRA